MYIIELPLRVFIGGKKKDFILNLNNYRNAHFRVLHKAKENYEALIWDRLPNVPVPLPIQIEFILYPKTKAICDPSNAVSIIEKFVCDSLVNKKIIPDDNFNIIKKHNGWTYGGVDKDNPRCELIIKKYI